MADGNELVLVWSGEVIPLAEPEQCVRALAEIRELEMRLREAKQELTFHLSQEFKRQGLKTLEFGGVKAELKGGSGIAWDVEVLYELLELGLPQERLDQLISTTVEYKVNAKEAQRIASTNEEYAEVVERAKQRYTKPVYIGLK